MILAHRPQTATGAPATQLVGQFDGSCHRTEQLGGAGYVIYTVSAGESRVLACRAVALPSCSDNIEAEILACLFLVEEMSTVARQIASTEGTFPMVVIQGDILPVVKYFQFAGRLRRLDMTNPLEQIRVIVSLNIPHALFLYQSRVANIVADNLAGQASNFIRARYHRCPAEFNRNGGPVSIRPAFPTPLLQVGGFKIQCSEQTWTCPTWILVERPRLDHGLLRTHLTIHPLHRQLIEGYLSPCLPQNSCIEVDYSPRSLDNLGRKYCCVMGGQRMPRDVRLLLFGQNHSEIDLRGSFYELIRRLGMLHMPSHSPLPPITDLRTLLSNDPYVQTVETLRPGTIKQLPLRVINSTIADTLRYLQSVHEGSPGAVVTAILNQLWLQAKSLTLRDAPTALSDSLSISRLA